MCWHSKRSDDIMPKEYGINPRCPQCKTKMTEIQHFKWKCKECGYSLEIRNWVHGENPFVKLYDRIILDVKENGAYKQYSFREFGKKFLGIKVFSDEYLCLASVECPRCGKRNTVITEENPKDDGIILSFKCAECGYQWKRRK